MPTRKSLESLLNNANVQKYLDLISQAEGTVKNGYATAFGGAKLTSLTDHPRTLHGFTETNGNKNKTSAAGRYQFLRKTWDSLKDQYELPDFGARSQDIGALALIADAGALNHVLKGDFTSAIKKTGTIWASLPSSPYAQNKRSWSDVNRMLGNGGYSGGGGGGGSMRTGRVSVDDAVALLKAPAANKSTPNKAQSGNKVSIDDAVNLLRAPTPKKPFVAIDPRAEAEKTVARQQGAPSAWQGALLGASDLGAGVLQGFNWLGDKAGEGINAAFGTNIGTGNYEAFNKQRNDADSWYQLRRQEAGKGFDLARLGGAMAGTAPLVIGSGGSTLAPTLGQVALRGAGTGAAIGGASFAPDASHRAGNTVLGAVGGAVGGVVGQKVGQGAVKVARAVKAKATAPNSSQLNLSIDTQINNALQRQGIGLADLDAQVQTAIKQAVRESLKAGKNVSPEAIERASTFASLKAKGIDLKPTLKQSTGDPHIWTRETELAKATGAEKLGDHYVAQQRTLRAALDDADRATGGVAENERQIMEKVYEGLSKQDDAHRNYIAAMYDTAKNHSGNDLTLDASRLALNADKRLESSLLDFEDLPSRLRKSLDQFQQGNKPFTLSEKEKMVQQINQALGDMKGPSTPQQRALKAFRQSLEQEADDSLASFGSSLQGQAKASWESARTAAAGRFKLLDDAPMLQKAIDDAEPDQAFTRLVWNGNYRELKSAVDLMKSNPESLNELKHGVMQRIIEKSTSELNDGISPKGLYSAINGIGNDKLQLLFSTKEIVHLNTLKRAAKYMISHPTGSNVNHSNSASQVLNAVRGLSKFPYFEKIAMPIANYFNAGSKINVSASQAIGKTSTAAAPKPLTIAEKRAIEAARQSGTLSSSQMRNQ